MPSRLRILAVALVIGAVALPLPAAPPEVWEHVLLISVDGLYQVDLANYVKSNPKSTLAALSASGVTYANAESALPSDSLPVLLALVTGGSPSSTGVWYDHTWNRYLLAPGATMDKPGDPGVDLAYDESIDKGFNRGKFGEAMNDPLKFAGTSAIDPSTLPVDPVSFKPVYPHDFLKVNTIFEVIEAAGKRTYWSDKHPAYDIVNGPSGSGVDELFTPEINSPVPGNKDGNDFTKAVADTIANDSLKVQALVNEIKGLDHAGLVKVAVPAIMGMNFQACTGRFPDLILSPVPGTVYGKPWKKIAEHGGFGMDDAHVALLISGVGLKPMQVNDPVRNQQVAPTILASLGLDPMKLQAVKKEGTTDLPGLGY